jgi:ssDNA-binding replication factor A large subunit
LRRLGADRSSPSLQVYFISRGSVRSVTKKFGRIKNDFEIQLDLNSQVIPAPESENFVAHIQYDFVSISDLAASPAGTVVDIIGTIMDVGEVATINTKRGMTPKRSITIGDDSRTSIGLTLWGKSVCPRAFIILLCSDFECRPKPLIPSSWVRLWR